MPDPTSHFPLPASRVLLDGDEAQARVVLDGAVEPEGGLGEEDEVAVGVAGEAAALDARDGVEVLGRAHHPARERPRLGVEDDVAAIEGLSEAMLVALGKKGIKTLDDLGDLATDELVSKTNGVLKDFGISEDDGNRIIMAARAHWFEDESAGEDAPADGTR